MIDGGRGVVGLLMGVINPRRASVNDLFLLLGYLF